MGKCSKQIPLCVRRTAKENLKSELKRGQLDDTNKIKTGINGHFDQIMYHNA